MRHKIVAALASLQLIWSGTDLAAQNSVTVQTEVPAQGSTRLLIQSPVLIIDSVQLFNESLLGRTLRTELQEARRALQAENDAIAAELEAEERELTQRRSEIDATEFRTLAEAFDEKAQRIRSERALELQRLADRLEREQQSFLNQVAPVLEEIMREAGAAVILEKREVSFHVRAIDITGVAIERIDREFVPATQDD